MILILAIGHSLAFTLHKQLVREFTNCAHGRPVSVFFCRSAPSEDSSSPDATWRARAANVAILSDRMANPNCLWATFGRGFGPCADWRRNT